MVSFQVKSEFDLLLATGAGSAFYNYQSFKDIGAGLRAKNNGAIEGIGGYKEWFFKQPNYYR